MPNLNNSLKSVKIYLWKIGLVPSSLVLCILPCFHFYPCCQANSNPIFILRLRIMLPLGNRIYALSFSWFLLFIYILLYFWMFYFKLPEILSGMKYDKINFKKIKSKTFCSILLESFLNVSPTKRNWVYKYNYANMVTKLKFQDI